MSIDSRKCHYLEHLSVDFMLTLDLGKRHTADPRFQMSTECKVHLTSRELVARRPWAAGGSVPLLGISGASNPRRKSVRRRFEEGLGTKAAVLVTCFALLRVAELGTVFVQPISGFTSHQTCLTLPGRRAPAN